MMASHQDVVMSAPTYLAPSVTCLNWEQEEGPTFGPTFPVQVPRPTYPPPSFPGTSSARPTNYKWRRVYVGGMKEVFVEEDAVMVGQWDTGVNGLQWYFHKGVRTDPSAWRPILPWSWPTLVEYFRPGEWVGRDPNQSFLR